MNRRSFLTATGAGAAALAFPAVLRAQTDTIRVGFPLPLTGPFAALGGDLQRGAIFAEHEACLDGRVGVRAVALQIQGA